MKIELKSFRVGEEIVLKEKYQGYSDTWTIKGVLDFNNYHVTCDVTIEGYEMIHSKYVTLDMISTPI
jgi:hypothetical protein